MFTPCKAEQPPQGMELQEKKHKKDYRIKEAQKRLQDTENRFRKSLQSKDAC